MSCAEVGDALRCPASKFITHTLSNLTFLILLTAGTFRLGDKIYPITSTEDLISNRFDTLTYDEQLDSHRQTDRQTDREEDRQTERQRGRGTGGRTTGQSSTQHVSSCERTHHQHSSLHHDLDSRSVALITLVQSHDRRVQLTSLSQTHEVSWEQGVYS